MSDADGGGSDQPLVLLACALGRLGVDSESGELSSDLHQLLADSLNQQTATAAKPARAHLKAILKKGAHKLQPGRNNTPATRHTCRPPLPHCQASLNCSCARRCAEWSAGRLTTVPSSAPLC